MDTSDIESTGGAAHEFLRRGDCRGEGDRVLSLSLSLSSSGSTGGRVPRWSGKRGGEGVWGVRCEGMRAQRWHAEGVERV